MHSNSSHDARSLDASPRGARRLSRTREVRILRAGSILIMKAKRKSVWRSWAEQVKCGDYNGISYYNVANNGWW